MIELCTMDAVAEAIPSDFERADLEFYGINHFRPSFLTRVFFNDPELTAENASDERPTYAGSFAIFGHQSCSGSEGHCEVHEHLRRFDDRPSHPLTRAFKRVIITEALRSIRDAQLVVTLVAATDPNITMEFDGPLLDFNGMQLSTFR